MHLLDIYVLVQVQIREFPAGLEELDRFASHSFTVLKLLNLILVVFAVARARVLLGKADILAVDANRLQRSLVPLIMELVSGVFVLGRLGVAGQNIVSIG